MTRRPVRAASAAVALVAALAVALGGCAAQPTTGSATPVAASAVPTTAPSAAPAAPGGPRGFIHPAVRRVCLGLAERDCLAALDAAAAALGPDRPIPVYVEVGPFGCRAGVGCERSLAARPEGRVLVEYAEGDAVEVAVTLAGDGTLAAEVREAFGVRLPADSAPDGLGGPLAVELGHCGLWSGIDVAGSWWDPVGTVDSDHADAINAAAATFAPLDRTHALLTSAGGLVVQLERRDGPKWLPLCG